MPYQFVLGSPVRQGERAAIEYFSEHADRGDVPNIVTAENRAMRFKTQAEAGAKIADFMQAKLGQKHAMRRLLGREEKPLYEPQDSSPIYILPVE
ncbi:hypothetical protein [Burkholderia phage FLC9]|nr:hypothetical protein [Burkholderia phage FLC9]